MHVIKVTVDHVGHSVQLKHLTIVIVLVPEIIQKCSLRRIHLHVVVELRVDFQKDVKVGSHLQHGDGL